MKSNFSPKLFPKKECVISLFVSLAFSLGAIGQKTMTGIIKNETGAALSGVSIVLKDNITIGTTTNASGNFSLNLPAKKSTLTISSIGYISQDVDVRNLSTINIVLATDKMNLNEVVVTGYSSQQKKDISG